MFSDRLGVALFAALVASAPGAANAQIRVHPTGANVSMTGATSVLLTFAGLTAGQTAAEGIWCGELVPAAPDVGLKCDPATVFGSLPARFDRSRLGASSFFSDVMSVPTSVTRRALQAARTGQTPSFFYVRRFVRSSGPDEYVTVTCRLTGGGVRTPLSLVGVKLAFADGSPVANVEPRGMLSPLAAEIRYTGTGRLKGRWEVVAPGEEPPAPEDLLTEATLPIERRGQQRRYAEIERFNIYLPPTGHMTLPGPRAGKLPTHAVGTYFILLRIEVSDDADGDSGLTGASHVPGGAVAGFPLPVLRYIVGGPAQPASGVALLRPADGKTFVRGDVLDFAWRGRAQAIFYRLEIDDRREIELAALVPAGIGAYRAPPWVGDMLDSKSLRWRVVALDARGQEIEASGWRNLDSPSLIQVRNLSASERRFP